MVVYTTSSSSKYQFSSSGLVLLVNIDRSALGKSSMCQDATHSLNEYLPLKRLHQKGRTEMFKPLGRAIVCSQWRQNMVNGACHNGVGGGLIGITQ